MSAETPTSASPDNAAERLVMAAVSRLSSDGPAAIRLLVAPGELLRSGLDMSRDSAYRVLRVDGQSPGHSIALAASARINGDIAWGGAASTATEMASAYVDDASNPTPVDRLRAALLADVVASFDSESWPAGFLLQTAAIPCSRRWTGPRPTDAADRMLGEQILRDRLAHYAALTELYEPLLHAAMLDLGLRPAGRTTQQVLRLLHCLIDGAVLRMFIDPDLQAEDVADALVRLGVALGEPGSIDDPRRPPDAARRVIFERLVNEARRWWSLNPSAEDVDTREVAELAGVAEGALEMLLPTTADIADSILRSELVTATAAADDTPTVIGFGLAAGGALVRRIASTVDLLPQACAAIERHAPLIGGSVKADSAAALLTLLTPALSPDEVARLNEGAWGGSQGLATASDLLTTILLSVPRSSRT